LKKREAVVLKMEEMEAVIRQPYEQNISTSVKVAGCRL